MARPEAAALAGFFPTPEDLLDRIAAIVSRPNVEKQESVALVDPCAGEGDAIVGLATRLCPNRDLVTLYTCEMEATRAATLKAKVNAHRWANEANVLSGDSFRVVFERSRGASLLFLNPPYDTDRQYGRLEHRFLERFTGTLAEDGVLLFLVPYYALAASAEYLATHYEVDDCFRFPDPDFATYKQVVLAARRREPRLGADAAIEARVLAWAESVEGMRELPHVDDDPPVEMRAFERWSSGGLSTWRMHAVDIAALSGKYRAWSATARSGAKAPVAGIEPDLPLRDLLLRAYPLATLPRPAHIAAGIASGLFNGARVESTRPRRFPPLLVKGVFDREYRTVDERRNKDGDVTALVQVQQPKLVTTVLDLRAKRYHVLGSAVEESTTSDVAGMTVADLLKHYGDSLMQVMRRQCPVLYDPSERPRLRLARTPRRLFAAQEHAARALVKLLERGRSAILLGEIGSGKSTVSLVAARTHGARRPLILCPPHLLRGWTNEIAAVLPNAEVRVLNDVADVESLASAEPEKLIVSILSRETAKLAHAWRAVEGACPRCGGSLPESVDLAKKRARCERQVVTPKNRLARIAIDLAERLASFAPTDYAVQSCVERSPHARRRLASMANSPKPFDGPLPVEWVREALEILVAREEQTEASRRAIIFALLAVGDDSAAQVALVEEQRAKFAEAYAQGAWRVEDFKRSLEAAKNDESWATIAELRLSWKDGVLRVAGFERASLAAATEALAMIVRCARFDVAPVCGEPLFQAVPEPRRVALAQHIARYFPEAFDFLILDEGHEYASDTSAQSFSAHRLSGLGKPTILMTGTIMNGYAESLFVNMWALSPDFRREFTRDEKQKFVDRYGYRKRVVEDRDEEGSVVEYGSNSDRITRSERVVGNAPGVLPLFLLRHLLPISVTLHKADLAIDLPPCRQERCDVAVSPELKARFERLQRALVDQIKSDRFEEGLAGKLWGQLAELPSYLDRATSDVGNVDTGDYEIRYPESVDVSNPLVAVERGSDPNELLPKERWMIDKVERELSEGRRVMVFAWHVKLLPRLARLIEHHLGEPAPILFAEKVGTAKRQDWIDREVVKKGRRVLVTNPVAIQTGLNNLVHFATEVWMQNPACNPVVYRQAIGRVDRIGQKLETRIFFPVYAETLQAQLYDLLAKKVAVSISTDGLDSESALVAAGVGESDALAALSIGRQLWAMLNEAA